MIGYLDNLEIIQLCILIIVILFSSGICIWFLITEKECKIKKRYWLILFIAVIVSNIAILIGIILWLTTYYGGWEGITYLRFIMSLISTVSSVCLITLTFKKKEGEQNEKTS